jgi:hypothetical protein
MTERSRPQAPSTLTSTAGTSTEGRRGSKIKNSGFSIRNSTQQNRIWKKRKKRNQRRLPKRDREVYRGSQPEDCRVTAAREGKTKGGRNIAEVPGRCTGDIGALGSTVQVRDSFDVCANLAAWSEKRGPGEGSDRRMAEGNGDRLYTTGPPCYTGASAHSNAADNPRSGVDHPSNVGVSESSCRYPTSPPNPPHTGRHEAPMECAEVRPVWAEENYQVCRVAGFNTENCGVSRSNESNETSQRHLNSPFAKTGIDDIFGGMRTRDVRDTGTIRAHTDARCKSGSTEVCGPDTISARSTEAVSVVQDTDGIDRWAWCSDPTLVNILREWHIDSGLAGILASEEIQTPYTIAPGVYYKECPQVVMHDQGRVRIIRPARQMCRAPLAEITPNRMRLDKIREIMTATRQIWLQWIERETLSQHIEEVVPGKYVGRYMAREEERLVEWGVIETTKARGIVMPVFKVPKGKDSRLIVDCREVNRQLPRPGNMELPSLHQVFDDLLRCKWVAQYDGKSYFYQIPLPANVRDYFQVKLGGARGKFVKYRLKVLPMGYAYAPAIAQAISNTILDQIRRDDGAVAYAWIDNFLFGASTKEGLEEIIRRFKAECKRLSVELKEECTEPAKKMDVLGATIDVEEGGKIYVGSKLMRALEKEQVNLEKASEVTNRDVYRVLGKVLWALWAIARTPLANCERLLVIMREIAQHIQAGAQWDAVTPVTSVEEMASVVKEMRIKREWKPGLRGKVGQLVGWTDASEEGLGYLLQKPDSGTLGWMAKGPQASIFIRELWAAAKMIAAVSWYGGGTVVVDNQAAIRALVTGHSSSAKGNAVLRRLAQILGPGAVEIAWTESRNQSADGLSRGIRDMCPRFGPWRSSVKIRWWRQEN